MTATFQALYVDKGDAFTVGTRTITLGDLPAGDVVIKTAYSCVNYKDGLAAIPEGKIVRSYPFIPGIDVAGYVVSSTDGRYHEGQAVLVHGYEYGVSHYGGYSEYVRVPADWVTPLPEGMTPRDAMICGTAGFTAALSVLKLEEHGIRPDKGSVLVTGATGGVGSFAVALLAGKGYTVAASTGKTSGGDYLRGLGASEVLSREDVYSGTAKPLDKQLWQAAVDPVGGPQLAAVLSKIAYGGAVAVSGLTGGTGVPTTVMPFILRGVSLLGIDAVYCPMDKRAAVWSGIAAALARPTLESMVDREIGLDGLPKALTDILDSSVRGRVLVRFPD